MPEHHETAAEDENVGSYYLENKDWKGALSRFQSALVLDPDNPDVYWGLAESERHLGDFADARANYQKVMEYDPGQPPCQRSRQGSGGSGDCKREAGRVRGPTAASIRSLNPRPQNQSQLSLKITKTPPTADTRGSICSPQRLLTIPPTHRNVPSGSLVATQPS